MLQKISDAMKDKDVKYFNERKDLVINSIEAWVYSGYIELNDGFRIGFIFSFPDYLSVFMSDKEIEEQRKIYKEKRGIE